MLNISSYFPLVLVVEWMCDLKFEFVLVKKQKTANTTAFLYFLWQHVSNVKSKKT